MKEIRCSKCNKLLAKQNLIKTEGYLESKEFDIEIQCPRCKKLNKF